MTERGAGILKWGFIAPTLVLLIAFNIFPLAYDVALSFTDASLAGDSRPVGGANYATIFGQDRYAQALRTTALFVVLAVGIELVLGFVVALAIHRPFRGKTALLTLLLVPMMLSPAIMGLFWKTMLSGDYGLINHVLRGLGADSPPSWLNDPDWKLLSLVAIDVWMWTPFMMLIALAALGSIPNHLYEAAEVDRASRWTVFRRITLPLCAPLLGLAVLLRTTDAIKQFDLVMAITGPNDPSTQTVSALIYQDVIKNFKVGLGAGYAVVVLVVVIAVAVAFTRYLDWMQRRQQGAAEAA